MQDYLSHSHGFLRTLIDEIQPVLVYFIVITLEEVHMTCLNWLYSSLFFRCSTLFSSSLYDFSVAIPRCYMDTYTNKFLSLQNQTLEFSSWNFFCLTYDLSRFKSGVVQFESRNLVFWDHFSQLSSKPRLNIMWSECNQKKLTLILWRLRFGA